MSPHGGARGRAPVLPTNQRRSVLRSPAPSPSVLREPSGPLRRPAVSVVDDRGGRGLPLRRRAPPRRSLRLDRGNLTDRRERELGLRASVRGCLGHGGCGGRLERRGGVRGRCGGRSRGRRDRRGVVGPELPVLPPVGLLENLGVPKEEVRVAARPADARAELELPARAQGELPPTYEPRTHRVRPEELRPAAVAADRHARPHRRRGVLTLKETRGTRSLPTPHNVHVRGAVRAGR